MTIHDKILALSKKLGYNHDGGYCFGFSMLWITAQLLDDNDVFSRRIEIINYFEPEIITKNINILREEIKQERVLKSNLELSANGHALLDIAGFYDNLFLYHCPELNAPVFMKNYYQEDYEKVSLLAATDALIGDDNVESHQSKMRGLRKMHSQMALYYQQDVINYLSSLAQCIDANCDKPVGMLLSSDDHAIALSYKPNTDIPWSFMDINQYPAQQFKTTDLTTIALLIKKAFRQQDILYFNTDVIIAAKDYKDEYTKKFQAAITPCELTASKIQSTTDIINFIIIAIKNGDVDIIKKLIKQGVDINKASNNEITPLYAAAIYGHTETIKILLDNSVDVNQADKDGCTALYIAVENGHTAAIKMLLDKEEVNVNIATNNGLTPLYLAAECGNIGMVKILLDKGANVNQADKDGWGPLHIATKNGHTEIVKMLLDKKGANVNTATNNGLTSLYMAVEYGYTEIVKLLLEYGATGLDLLYMAVEYGHVEVVKILLKKGADVNQVNDKELTVLHVAVIDSDADLVKILLAHGADLNKTYDSLTPLKIAENNNQVDIVEILKKAEKININHKITNNHVEFFANNNNIHPACNLRQLNSL